MSVVNLHIYPSPFKFESRILRETKSIIQLCLSDEIIIASGWSKGLQDWEQIDQQRSVKRFKLFFDRFHKNSLISIFKYFEFIIRVFIFYKRKNVAIINCHSLFVLPIGYLLKLFNPKVWLIYDAHELESQKTGLNRVSAFISAIMERFLIKRTNRLIVVSPSIKEWYENKYKLSNVVVLRNTPEMSNITARHHVFNDMFNIPKTAMIFIYQGVVNKGRGIELLINAFSRNTLNKHLIIMGYGPLVDLVKDAEQNTHNIHFLPAVHPSEIGYYTSGADVGLSVIENMSLSYYYCLPNKLFEYLHSGLPVIVSNFPDMSTIINQFDCGWVTEVSSKSLEKIINNISANELSEKCKGVVNVRREINWEKERGLLIGAFPICNRN